jgi:hypothetical protein
MVLPSHILPLPLHILSALCSGLFISVYAVGAARNIADLDYTILGKIGVLTTIVLLVPVSSVIEAVAVVYALIRPMKTEFQVVEKN